MRGTAEGQFSPGTTLTRAILVTVQHHMAGEPAAGTAIHKKCRNLGRGMIHYELRVRRAAVSCGYRLERVRCGLYAGRVQ